jgi:hypothetical protein
LIEAAIARPLAALPVLDAVSSIDFDAPIVTPLMTRSPAAIAVSVAPWRTSEVTAAVVPPFTPAESPELATLPLPVLSPPPMVTSLPSCETSV